MKRKSNRDTKKMLTTGQLADLLNVHPNTVRQWCEHGLLRAYRVGTRGDRRFRPEDVDRFLRVDEGREHAVLIVDDDDTIRNLLYDIVTGKGYRAIAVASGESALEELEEREFDLIFLDLVLPGLSGADILRQVKASNGVPVVTVITGYANSSVAVEATSLCPMFFIRKPFDVNDILTILDLTMRLRR